MKIKIIVAIGMIVLSFTNCKKAEKGEAGTAGKDGNANVNSVTLSASSWSWDGSQYWRYALWTNVSILTSDVVNGGAVMLYQNVGSGNFVPLPVTQNITGTVQEHDFFQYGLNTITVIIENSDLSDPNPSAFTYKLVCIPKAARMANPNVNMLDYNKVKAAYGLKD